MKIKMSIIKISILSILLLFVGCEDVLEKTPDGTKTLDQILEDHDLTEGLLSAAYSMMETVRDNIFWFQTLEVLSDNAFTPREDGFSAYWWHNGLLSKNQPCVWPGTGAGGSASNTEAAWWYLNWYGARLANLAIKYIPQSTVITETEMRNWVDQARLLRAYYYFQLIQYYGPLPFFDEPFEADFTGWQDITRPTYNEIATTIADECDAVISNGRTFSE